MPDSLAVTQTADGLAVHTHVGDDVDLRQPLDEAAPALLHGCPVEIAKPAAECDQVLITEGLVAEQQHRMIVPRLHDARECARIRGSEIDATHGRAERGTGRNHLDGAGAHCGYRSD